MMTSTPPPGAVRTLVVEDNVAMQGMLKTALARLGHEVTITGNGAEALRALDDGEFDLIITDLIMPEMEGLQFLRELKQRPSAPKVIATSGGGHGAASNYLGIAGFLGAAATMEKPFTPQELADTIARVLARP
jgi:CheY-like chemotaxis protein